MKNYSVNTAIATTFGTILSVFGVSSHDAFAAFFLGGLGAVGAYIFVQSFKWVIKKIVDSIKL